MAAKDISSKNLEAYNDVFSDIVNFFLFKGRQVVSPEDLQDTQQQSQFKVENELHEQERDVSKYWGKSKIRIALFGLENQTKVDKDMPLRVLAYDGEAYKGQILTKPYVKENEKRYPVITLVLYFGQTRWDRWKSLYECIDVPQAIKSFVWDYKINLFEVAYLSLADVKLFKSDFKHVVQFLVQKRLKVDYTPSDEELKHVDEVLKMMTVLTGNKAYINQLKSFKRRPRNMCEVTEGLINKGVEQGRKEMQPKVDAAEARALKAESARAQSEAEVAALKKKVAELEAQLAVKNA